LRRVAIIADIQQVNMWQVVRGNHGTKVRARKEAWAKVAAARFIETRERASGSGAPDGMFGDSAANVPGVPNAFDVTRFATKATRELA
jgi:hypothetical protein